MCLIISITSVAGVSGGVRGLWIGRVAGFLATIDLVDWGEVPDPFGVGHVDVETSSRGRGAIGIAISAVLLYAGYP